MQRRDLLVTEPNPDGRLDYVVSLEERAPLAGDGTMHLGLRYVPDRLILQSGTLARYLQALAGLQWNSLEEVAVIIRDDVNNEVVPRWLQVTLSAADAVAGHEGGHGVMLEDRQPKWDNPALLSRLRLY